MDNPEYTERMIQSAIKAQTDLPITLSWNGYDPSAGETANFEVYYDGYDTNYWVWDHGGSFEVVWCDADSLYRPAASAVRFDRVAKAIIELIEEDIASGKLGEEE